MSIDYTRDKLFRSVSTLIGSGVLQDRIADAASTMLGRLDPEFKDTPNFPGKPQLQARLQAVLTRLGRDGAFETARKLTDDEAKGIADEILDLFIESDRLSERSVRKGGR